MKRAFTLVEVLIVVIILGILAAVVFPQFARATDDAAFGATNTDLQKLRRAIEVYRARNASLPPITAGDGKDGHWGVIVGPEYLRGAPVNSWVGGDNATVIVIGNAPDADYQTDHGWIYDDTTGQLWAGSFDDQDQPLPRP